MKKFTKVSALVYEHYSNRTDVWRPVGATYINIGQIAAVGPVEKRIGFNNMDEWLEYNRTGGRNTTHECELFKVILAGGDSTIFVDVDDYDDVVALVAGLDEDEE